MAVAVPPQRELGPPRHRPLTVEEFFALPEGPPDLEFEEGELIQMPRPRAQHQAILRELVTELALYLRNRSLGSIWPEVDVQITPGRVYVPDLVYLSSGQMERYLEKQGRIIGGPDLVVEIVSPSSAGRDRVGKFNVYRAAGVQWYWLIDSETLTVEEYRLTENGYLAVARVASGEPFQPQLFPGLQIDLARLLGIAVESEQDEV